MNLTCFNTISFCFQRFQPAYHRVLASNTSYGGGGGISVPLLHGSSEGHEMLKRNDKYHSIADDVPIPKM